MTENENIQLQNGYALGYILGGGAIENVSRFYKEITLKYPDIFLANKARSIIGVVQDVHELKISLYLNDVDTVSFRCEKYNNGKLNKYYESIEDLMLIFIPKYGWYEISVTEHTDGYDWYKEVSAQSLEVELGQRILRVMQINSTESNGDTADEDYKKILFFNPLDTEHSALHKILKDTGWMPGHVDNSLWNKSRSFDIENQDVYSFLTGDIATQYNCLFQFDTFTKTVNAYDLDIYGEDTNIYMDMETIVQSIDISCNKDNIKTCLYVDGGDNIDVRDVNINGTNKIYNFDYYKKFFRDETRTVYEQYLVDCDTIKDSEEYINLVADIKNKLTEISEINYRMPQVSDTVLDYASMSEEDWKIYEQEVDLSSVTDWSTCGVWLLETRLQQLEDNEELYQQDVEMYCKETSPNYADYVANHTLLVECENALNERKSELATAESELEALKQQKNNMIETLAVENYFTDEQWEEISAYIREDTFSNDSYLAYATDSTDYVMETTQALFDAAAKELDKYCKPQYSFSTSIANLFKIPEFDSVKKDFTLGNFIRLGVDGLVSKLRLIKIDIDFDTDDIEVEYSDAIRTDDGYCDAASIQALASSVSSTVSFNKSQWNNGGYAGEYVDKHLLGGINTGDLEITSKDGNLNINRSGILLTDGNSLKQAKWLNNKLLFTKDRWKTVESAFGEITYTDPLTGETVTTYGLIANSIIGQLLLGQRMVIANTSTTFEIGEEGLTAYSQDKDTVLKINPNATDKIIEITTGLNSTENTVFYVGADGNAYLNSEIITKKGNIGGWEVDSNSIKSAKFDDASTTNGIRLDSNGEIRSKGSWYSSVDGSGIEGWFSRLCSGKWIFGYYDSTQSDPFVPPTGTPYSDISVNGIYMCSQDTILNKSSQYLFAVDTTNDTVSITNSSSNSPALTITNNYFSDDNSYDAPALVLHSPKQGYRNRPLDVRMRVTGEILGAGQSVDNEYCMQMFGEQEHGRIIFRSSKIVGTVNDDGTVTYAPEGNTADTESADPLVPSMIGSSTFRWFQGYFMELYSTNGLNTSSDKKIKNHIQDIDANKSLELINSLTPVEYTLKNNANNRKHMGFYAQDVKKTCDDMELGNMSLYAATWHKDGQEQECYYSEDAPDEELQWTLKYEEFIAPLVGAVQALTKRVEDLEADNEKLRTRIEKLEDASE